MRQTLVNPSLAFYYIAVLRIENTTDPKKKKKKLISLKKKNTTTTMEGGKNYDSLPGDITLRIFSLLPLYLVVLRLRLVCKVWYALITGFADEYLKRSKETSLGIVCCNSRRISSGVCSLDISSLQIRVGIKTLMTKPLSTSPRFAFNNSINGLICLDNAKKNIHVYLIPCQKQYSCI